MYPNSNDDAGLINLLNEEGLLILGLNSAWEIDHHFLTRASICPESIAASLDQIRTQELYQNKLKIAVWHHPLSSPFEDRIKDFGFMERLAQGGFSICLRGHLHKADCQVYKYDHAAGGREIHIIGAGTFGSPIKEWYAGYPLQYNLIKISGKNLTVETRRRTEINGAWQPDAIWTQGPGMDPLPRYFINLTDIPEEKPLTKDIQDRYHFEIAKIEKDKKLSREIYEYRRKAEALHESIPLAGFRTSLRVPIKVKDIYVPLRAMVDMRLTGKACFADAEDAEKHLKETRGGREISIPDAFVEANKKNRRGIVILGDPGSGKTTHLKRVLLWCLQDGLSEHKLPEDIIPVFLPLRQLKDITQSLDAFLQEQLDQPHLGTQPGFGKRLLDRGSLLFLLDGLDEVADTVQRIKVSCWIENAMRIHATCRFVVTCRFAGYTDETRLCEDFLEMHMRPLSSEQADSFVHKWYRIVETEFLRDKDQAEIIAREKADDLLQKLQKPEFRSARIFTMTRNPLLLTNICLVHLDRGNLPHTRADLYDECTDVLLERWRGATGFIFSITAQAGRRVLQPAAFWLHQEEGGIRARSDEICPVIEPALRSVGWTHGTAQDFLKAVRNERGILTAWDQEFYGFMHLGFQEYLAAREIRSRFFSDPPNPSPLHALAARFGESWWQEVGLLLLALEEPSLFVPYMRALVKLPAFAAYPELVEMCLDDAAETSPTPFLELIKLTGGTDTELWKRQLLALQIVARMDKSLIKDLIPRLKKHPCQEIHTWLQNFSAQALQDVIYSEISGIELVRIPGGTFMMGSSFEDTYQFHYEYEESLHEVSVPTFYMGRYPVTNGKYAHFLRDNPKTREPAFGGDTRFNQPRQPVVGISWADAELYAKWAGLRLPTESEWEYACQARSVENKLYYTGNDESDLWRAGWYYENSKSRPSPVGEKEPNDFGLYDMHGNVWEWLEDDWHYNYEGAPDDGSAWVDRPRGEGRVVRGGSWSSYDYDCRITCRDCWPREVYHNNVGFRLAKSLL